MHAVAEVTARRMREVARVDAVPSVGLAYLRALVRRARGRRWVPAGGSVPLGALGQVSAALELAEQMRRGGVDPRVTLVAPLGSGGTVAGLLVGLAIAGLPTPIVGVQVVPRLVANGARVRRLALRTRALLERLTGERLPPVDVGRLLVDRSAYGGAYGRETGAGREAADVMRSIGGPRLEPTYSAKAFAVALRQARASPDERVLFWLTFDGSWLDDAV
jgi:D-cysteine desulfhydrase